MRILLLNQYYPPDVAPTGQVLHDLARLLVRRGHQVDVICSQRSYDGGHDFASRETLDGVQITRLPALGLGRRGFLSKIADYASFYSLLARQLLFLPRNPDLIVSLTTPPFIGLLGKFAAQIHQSRHAHWIMDVYPDVMAAHGILTRGSMAYGLLAALTRFQFRGAASVISLGPLMAQQVGTYLKQGTGADNSAWIPLWGGLELSPWPAGTLNPMRAQRGMRDDELVLMYSGNMGLGHRFGEFLAAAERLGESGPRWVFAGSGKRLGEIETFAREHPCARIEFQPYVSRSQLRESLSAADVHLVSQDGAWNGLLVPSKIQGIFAVGRPAIFVGSRACEAAQWVEQSGGGWVVAEGDVEGLVRAIGKAGDRAERARRGVAAWQFAQEHFDAERNCGRIASIIESLVPATSLDLNPSADVQPVHLP